MSAVSPSPTIGFKKSNITSVVESTLSSMPCAIGVSELYRPIGSHVGAAPKGSPVEVAVPSANPLILLPELMCSSNDLLSLAAAALTTNSPLDSQAGITSSLGPPGPVM